MAPKFKFQENEKVLCFHGPLLYEAKCIKAQVKDKTIKYFIHYSGWNNKWDEWVPESRVLKMNETNTSKQKELADAHIKAKKESKKAAAALKGSGGLVKDLPGKKRDDEKSSDKSTTLVKKRDTPSTSGKDKSGLAADDGSIKVKKRIKVEANVESEEHYMQKIEIKIKIPDDLKNRLADDWDFICRQKKLVKLPCEYSVDRILKEYLQQKISVKGTTSSKESAITEVTAGIRDYFNSMLGKHLLYKFERQQFSQIIEEMPGKQICEIYGAVHLLRMFSLLGRFLAYTPLDEKAVQLLLSHLHDFLRYICRNAQYCNMCEYITANPDHNKNAS